MSNPLVSVLLPIYNAEMFVAEAVESILAQSMADFELILINDGSKDRTQNILLELSGRDPRIILISRENRGIVSSLNEGIGMARGRWIARMDADDVSLPIRFERQLQWLEQNRSDICGCWIKYFGAVEGRIVKHPQSDSAIKMAMLFGSPFAHPSVMMNADLAKGLMYSADWEKCEDYELWTRAAMAGWKMTNIPEVLLLYRQHASQVSTATTGIQQALTQKVRRQYWTYICEKQSIDASLADSILQMRDSPPYTLDMNDVDHVFDNLLRSSVGETRSVLLDHASRLYFRVAADYPDIASRWTKLNALYGINSGLATRLMLWAVARLGIRSDSGLFSSLKSFLLGWR